MILEYSKMLMYSNLKTNYYLEHLYSISFFKNVYHLYIICTAQYSESAHISGFSDRKPVPLDSWLTQGQFVLMAVEGILSAGPTWRYIWENQVITAGAYK